MKVLDLQCKRLHLFEGWFSSEQDFIDQTKSGSLTCPVCDDPAVSKRLSAPRLNLRSRGSRQVSLQEPLSPAEQSLEAQSVLMTLARRLVSSTEDVGSQFAEEARKIHYGEVAERGIRGRATVDEAESLIEEGIAVLPFILPDSFKEPLQ